MELGEIMDSECVEKGRKQGMSMGLSALLTLLGTLARE